MEEMININSLKSVKRTPSQDEAYIKSSDIVV